ncbi:MAG: methyltransferase family protein [Thiobacillaceae bacterium]
MRDILLIALAWFAYGLVHSWLAGRGVKAWVMRHWPRLAPAYRLAYNAIATLLLIPPLALTLSMPGEVEWDVPSWIAWPAAIAAVAGFVWSLRWYDMGEFLGLAQWRRHDGREQEGFVLSPLHRYVRHPWYGLGLLLLWTRDLNAAWLTTAVVLSIYLLIGSRLEERKLVERYGEAYRRYQARVPGLIPWPGRCLSPAEAEALRQAAGKTTTGA